MDICLELIHWTVRVRRQDQLFQVPFWKFQKMKNECKVTSYHTLPPFNYFNYSYCTSITFITITTGWCILTFLGLKGLLIFSMRGVLLFTAVFRIFCQCLNKVSSSDHLFVQGFQKMCGWLLFECTADLSIAWCEWKMKLHWKNPHKN